MEKLSVGDKVKVKEIEGTIISNPRYQRNIQISLGINYGVWMVPRKEVRKVKNG
jgi:hypothetical protein